MRDWNELDKAYSELLSQQYDQPDSAGHLVDTEKAVEWFMARASIGSVLDIGCSTGFACKFFEAHGVEYTGVDYAPSVAQSLGRRVVQGDFNFLPDGLEADAGFARHVLEHSPFPHMTLMSWRRVAKRYLFVVLPSLEWFRVGVKGTNHFAVWNMAQWEAAFGHADWSVADKFVTYHSGRPDRHDPNARTEYEYWFLLQKIGG